MKKKYEWFTVPPVIINFVIDKYLDKNKIVVNKYLKIAPLSIFVNIRNYGVYQVQSFKNGVLEFTTIAKHKRSVGHKKFDSGDICFFPVKIKRKRLKEIFNKDQAIVKKNYLSEKQMKDKYQ